MALYEYGIGFPISGEVRARAAYLGLLVFLYLKYLFQHFFVIIRLFFHGRGKTFSKTKLIISDSCFFCCKILWYFTSMIAVMVIDNAVLRQWQPCERGAHSTPRISVCVLSLCPHPLKYFVYC